MIVRRRTRYFRPERELIDLAVALKSSIKRDLRELLAERKRTFEMPDPMPVNHITAIYKCTNVDQIEITSPLGCLWFNLLTHSSSHHKNGNNFVLVLFKISQKKTSAPVLLQTRSS